MRRTLPTLTLVAALALTACGGSDGDVSSPADPAATTSPTAPPETEAPAPSETDTPAPSETDVPADDPTGPAATPAEADCSGQTVAVEVVDRSDLPKEVDDLRRFLSDAALRCDEQLLQTAVDESSQFTYSFGEEGDFIGHLWRQEEQGEPVFAYLAQLLQTTPALADGGDVFVWPRVLTDRPEDTTDEAWAELVPIFGEERVEELRTGGDGMYLYWRVGISTDGEWRFYVAGD